MTEPNLTEKRFWGNPCPKCGCHVRYLKNKSCVKCHKVMVNANRARKAKEEGHPRRVRMLERSREKMAETRKDPEYRKKESAREKERYNKDPVFRARKIRRVVERERQMHKRNLGGCWNDQIQKIYDQARESGQTVDHIIPLNGVSVCGLHVPWNLRVISHQENSRKGNKIEEGI